MRKLWLLCAILISSTNSFGAETNPFGGGGSPFGAPATMPKIPAATIHMATPSQQSKPEQKPTLPQHSSQSPKDLRSPFANHQEVTAHDDQGDGNTGGDNDDDNNDNDDDSKSKEKEKDDSDDDDSDGDAATNAVEEAGNIKLPYIGTINILQASGVDPNKVEKSIKGQLKQITIGPLKINNVKAFKTKDGETHVIAYGKLSSLDVKIIMKNNEDGESIFDVYPKKPFQFHITPHKQITLKKFELTLGDEKKLTSTAPIDPKKPENKIHFTIMLNESGDIKGWIDKIDAASLFGFSQNSHFAKLLFEKLSLDIKNIYEAPEIDISCFLDPTHLKKMGLNFKKDEKINVLGTFGLNVGIDLIADITNIPLGHHGKIKEAKLIIQKSVGDKPLPSLDQSIAKLSKLSEKLASQKTSGDNSDDGNNSENSASDDGGDDNAKQTKDNDDDDD